MIKAELFFFHSMYCLIGEISLETTLLWEIEKPDLLYLWGHLIWKHASARMGCFLRKSNIIQARTFDQKSWKDALTLWIFSPRSRLASVALYQHQKWKESKFSSFCPGAEFLRCLLGPFWRKWHRWLYTYCVCTVELEVIFLRVCVCVCTCM